MRTQDHKISALTADERLLIDREHARLEQFLNDLRDVCCKLETQEACHQGCSREQIASCEGRLNSFLYDFLDLVAEHFENEEQILRASHHPLGQGEWFHSHQQEHARLMREVKALVDAASQSSRDGDTAASIRQLSSAIQELFGSHASIFDSAF